MKDSNEVVTLKQFKWEARKRKAKDFVKSIPQKVKKIWDEDKELVLFLAPGVIYTVKRLVKMNDGKKEEFHKNCQVYDQSLGMWHDLKKPMSAKQKTEFARRRKEGESVLSILTSMGILRR